jgi:hypothetical protein
MRDGPKGYKLEKKEIDISEIIHQVVMMISIMGVYNVILKDIERRETINGIFEYLPITLSFNNKKRPAPKKRKKAKKN